MKLSPKEWKKFYESRGLDESKTKIYVKYVNRLAEHELPVIFEFEHLTKLLGIEPKYLSSMINSPENFYRSFVIPKRSGGNREINSPYPSLLHCQSWIYKNILLKLPISNSAHGFVPLKSIFTNATQHLGKKAFLKMDLQNFFPSIPINWVINLFKSHGYPPNVSFYLAALCSYDGKLSQGAATSPYLSNILLRGLDIRLENLCNSYNLTYTRYADDMAFSGDYIPHKFISIVETIINNYKLSVNKNKTRLQCKYKGRRILTGLSIRSNEIKLPKNYKRKLKQELYFVEKYGVLSHLSRLKIRNPNYLESLAGKVQFWLMAEPNSKHANNANILIKNLMS